MRVMPLSLLLLFFVAWVAWAACAACRAGEPPVASGPNVVLVTLDGVRWQDVLDGAEPLPGLRRLMARGVVLGGDDAPMVASGPEFVSLPGYEEIFTGHAPRCADNGCRRASRPTLLDELRAHDRLLGDEIAVIASWERLARVAALDPRGLTISTGRHGGVSRSRLRVDDAAARLLDEAGRADAFPGHDDYRPDRYTAALALAYLRATRPRLLVVGLGDTDEHAHRGDRAGYLEALRAADAFVAALGATLDTLGDYGARTTIVVTTDHGRARDFVEHGARAPESGRVWLAMAGGGIDARGLGRAGRTARLADVAPTLRLVLGLPPDGSAGAGEPLVAPAALATR
jgi:hypothetical protein